MGEHWNEIKAMPSLKAIRRGRRIAGLSFHEVQKAAPPQMLSGKELRKRRDSTRSKRGSQGSA